MKFRILKMFTIIIIAFQIFSPCTNGANIENGQFALEEYLEAIINNDYKTAYNRLDSNTKQEISFSLFVRLQDLNKSIREVKDYKISFKGFDEKTNNVTYNKQQISLFTVDYSFKEKLAYSLPYISSSDFSLISEDGEWRILLNQTRQSIEEGIENHNIVQHEDYGSDINDFTNSLDEEIVSRMKNYGVEGCTVTLVENNEIVFNKPYGYSNTQKKIPVERDTVFNAGSVSKTISAWGALKLYESGLIDLDSPAHKYMKRWSFPKSGFDSGKITVRQLLEHRSGLGFSEKRGYGGYLFGSTIPDLVQSLRGDYYPQYAVRQEFAAEERFEYSNANYTVLQLIIEDVTGISFEEYMHKVVFEPLKMKNSTFKFDNINTGKFATGYNNSGKSLPLYLHTEQAAGGLYCTAEDLALFIIAMNRTLSLKEDSYGFLSQQTVKPILDVKTIDYKLGSYVFNSEIAPFLVEHQGHSQGYMALYAALPQVGSGIVFLTNSDNGKAVMQPLADKWLRWKAGPAKPIFSTLKYTLQKSRDRAEMFYILLLAIPAALLLLIIGFICFNIITRKRKLTTRYLLCYSKINIAICILAPAIIVLWWCVIYNRIFDKLSPFPETSFIDLTLSLLITLICACIMLSILFPKNYQSSNNEVKT